MAKGNKKATKSKGGKKKAAADGQPAGVESAVTAAVATVPVGPKGKEVGYTKAVPIGDVSAQKGFNDRTVFDEEKLNALAQSIKQQGIINFPVVRPVPGKDGKYHIVTGERRFRAAQIAGLDVIPVTVREDLAGDDVAAKFVALTTDTGEQAVPLSSEDRARAFLNLHKEHKLSVEDIAKRAGVSSRTVRRDLELVEAPKDVLTVVREKGLSTTAALELAKAGESPADRKRIVDELGDDLTEPAIRRKAKELAQGRVNDVEGGKAESGGKKDKGKKHNRATGHDRAANLVVPRSRTEINEKLRIVCVKLVEIRDEGKKAILESEAFIGLLSLGYALLWASGEFALDAVLPPVGDVAEDDIEPNQAARDKRLAAFWSRVEFHAAVAARAREELVRKEDRKAKKNKKGKKDNDGETAESDAEGELVGAGAE